MKKSLRIIFVLMVSLIMFTNTCFASQTQSKVTDDGGGKGAGGWQQSMINDANNLTGNWAPTGNVSKNVQSVMGTAINVIRIVGTGISLIMLTYIAIKYMSAAPNEQADFKKSATGFIVGAVILFASSNILKIIADFAGLVTAP